MRKKNFMRSILASLVTPTKKARNALTKLGVEEIHIPDNLLDTECQCTRCRKERVEVYD